MPKGPGREQGQDYEHVRHGVANIFMANEPLKGKRIAEVTDRKTKKERATFTRTLADEHWSEVERTTLVMDNFKTHGASAFYETFEPGESKRIWDRFEFVFTPRHGSWPNVAETELHMLNAQCLNRHIPSMEK